MLFSKDKFLEILNELKPHHASLVAVSKTKSAEAIKEAYDSGQKIFGENYVQELCEKAAQLPKDIQWHFIGHLQSNKVKQIAPFVSLIHSVDSFNLLKEINKQAQKNNRIIDCLLQIYIAQEETKFGLSTDEATQLLSHPDFSQLKNICVKGLMGMASLTADEIQIRKEFGILSDYFHQLQAIVFKTKPLNGKSVAAPVEPGQSTSIKGAQPGNLSETKSALGGLKPQILSMGMSSDYKIALEEGSTMVRIGSLIFGER